jgi:membrane protease YdiL (CAAX protease family)
LAKFIRFRDVALLVLGGTVAGAFAGLLTALAAYGFTDSKLVSELAFSVPFYATFVLGYHWLSQEQEWDSLRTRFAPVGMKILLSGALAAVAVLLFVFMAEWLLRRAGFDIADVPPGIDLHSWMQLAVTLPVAALLVPVSEELVFRGLLLDWLRQKMNAWAAALILSVVFSLLHLNPFSSGAIGWLAFADRFLLGLGASALVIKYRSLRPAFMMHATLNTIACIFIVLDGS